MSKRPRDEEESTTIVTDAEPAQEDPSRAPISKKLRIIQRVGPEVRTHSNHRISNSSECFVCFLMCVCVCFPQEEMLVEDSAEAEGVVPTDSQDGAEASQVIQYIPTAPQVEDKSYFLLISSQHLITAII